MNLQRAVPRRALGAMLALSAAMAVNAAHVSAASARDDPRWTRPVEPFRIVGNVYYVGTEGLASYLLVSPQGDILLDGALAADAPLIERSIAKLGFRLSDVKLLVNSHAHRDHAGGLAELKRDSGAQLWASAGDRWALEHGRNRGDDDYGGGRFPAVKVDHLVRDDQVLQVGSTRLTAALTPGHTPGCTSWSLPVSEGGRDLEVIFPCSLTVAGNVLVGNHTYPAIAADYRRSFARLRAMRADVVLPAHPEFADVLGRQARRARGDADAFVDERQLQRIVDVCQRDFERELAHQGRLRSEARPSPQALAGPRS